MALSCTTTRKGLCLLGISQVGLLVLASSQSPRVTVDVYTTNLNLARDTASNHTSLSLIRAKPVTVDLAHGINITPLFLGSSLLIAAFSFLTSHMCDTSPEDSLLSPYCVGNPLIEGNSAFSLWNFIFALTIAAWHATLFTATLSPCSVQGVALLSLLCIVPMVAVCAPRIPHGHPVYSNMQEGGVFDHDAAPHAPQHPYGVPPGLASIATALLASLWYMGSLQYDPTTYRVQALGLVIALDLLLLGLGHLWDNPPSVATVVNARLCFACAAAATNIAVLCSFPAAFPVTYTHDLPLQGT